MAHVSEAADNWRQAGGSGRKAVSVPIKKILPIKKMLPIKKTVFKKTRELIMG